MSGEEAEVGVGRGGGGQSAVIFLGLEKGPKSSVFAHFLKKNGQTMHQKKFIFPSTKFGSEGFGTPPLGLKRGGEDGLDPPPFAKPLLT